MITIVYSTHRDENYNKSFYNHLSNSVGLENVQILEYINKNEFSLSELYNRGIKESLFDIVVCVHNDVKLEKNWGKKLYEDFKNNPDYGIIGKAGSCYFPKSGVYWEKMSQTMVGHVYHHPPDKQKWVSKYSAKFSELIPVVTLDGLFLSFDKNKIKHIFDETIGKFHFYDHSFCVPNFLDGVKLGVTFSFDITHESIGMTNDEFNVSRLQFIEKWGDKLPLDLKPTKVFYEKIKSKPMKNVGKVAIIIPTKGKVDMLYDCIQSFEKNCDESMYEIFVADTGSTEEELNWMKSNLIKKNIHIIEYDYYNFAKINNDVVKNYVSESFEFLLFCNNDVVIINDVVYEMMKTFKEKNKVGTVGARLHYKDNTVQHNGIIPIIRKENGNFNLTHNKIGCYYSFDTELKEVAGNTAALLMIRKSIFQKIGMFNEEYSSCFEDVELNFKCIINGLTNYVSGKSVAYHHESKTRNEDKDNLKKLNDDFGTLIPFVNKNYHKLQKYFVHLA